MKKANISHVKNHLSRYLDYVRRGGTVRILDRDVPVADLVPPSGGGEGGADPRLVAMERAGRVRCGKGSLERIWRTAPIGPGGVLDALLNEREER